MEGVSAAANRFDYAEFVQRNIGFVSEQEQERMRNSGVFVCGVGGMGGACILSLVRSGFSNLAFADIDTFEASNLNRQVFAFIDTLGKDKAGAVRQQILNINPEARLETYGAEWLEQLDAILPRYRIVVNGMDDVRAGVQLYRKAKEHGATVVDAYASPLPSVTVVRPEDPRPEERLGYPTVGADWREISDAACDQCKVREIEHVMTHSSSPRHVDMTIAAEVIAGKRDRMAFAPMVITAGNLMCFEVVKLAIGRPSTTDCRGYFFNPWTGRVERPRYPLVAWIVRRAVRRRLERMAHGV